MLSGPANAIGILPLCLYVGATRASTPVASRRRSLSADPVGRVGKNTRRSVMLRLYDYWESGNCYQVRLQLSQLAQPFERVHLDIAQK